MEATEKPPEEQRFKLQLRGRRGSCKIYRSDEEYERKLQAQEQLEAEAQFEKDELATEVEDNAGASGEESDSEIEIDNARKGAEELATEVTVEDDTRTGGKELELEVEANTGASEDWRLQQRTRN